MVKSLFNKTKLLAAAVVMTVAMVATGVTVMVNNNKAEAATNCTQHGAAANIIYRGIDCHELSSVVSAFKTAYNNNNSGHSASPSVKQDYHDLQANYNWAGASQSLVSGMSTSNTALGTLYKDGHLTVNGETVGTDAWVTARFSGPSGYVHVTGNIYARKTTTSFAESSAQVLVVYGANGQVAFAVMVECGNSIKVTPKPVEKPVVACNQLAFNKKSDTDYTLTASASVKNATITGYTFTFGDGQTKDVSTSATSASADHTYKPGSYTANVSVSYKDLNGKAGTVSSAACAGKVTISQPEAAVTCDQLAFTDDKKLAYTFNASGSAKNATINSFTFDFGDGSAKKTVNASANKASASYTYKATGNYTASVAVTYTDLNNKQATTTSAKCAVKVTPTQPMCTVPGKENLPADSPECKPTPTMACNLLTITNRGTDTTSMQYNFTVNASATNATIDTYSVDFGDGTAVYNGAAPSIDHSYAKIGTYKIVASVTVSVDGKSQVVKSDACTGNVTITQPMCTSPTNGKQYPQGSSECQPPVVTPPTPTPTTPVATQLVNTGPGETIGLFTGFVIAGAAAHRIMANRRLFGLGR